MGGCRRGPGPKILTLNAGSNSRKFEIIEAEPNGSESDHDVRFGSSLAAGAYNDIGKRHSAFSLRKNQQNRKRDEIEIPDHGHATELLLEWIEHGAARDHGIHNLADVERIGHRVVHGADAFDGPITTPESSLQVWIIPTEEGLMIAKDVADYTDANHN